MKNTNVAPKSVQVLNDRYTMKFLLDWDTDKDVPYIQGAELGAQDRFIPREIHFHWGHKSTRGSEHLIDGQQFALEFHIVNYNERYGSVADAINRPDGLLAVSQLFRAATFSKKYFFMDFIDLVKETGSHFEMTSHLCRFALDNLIQIPPDQWNYVIYQGSFTTPPCYEHVKWMVFLDVQPVSEGQLARLRELKGLNGQIGDNFRPIQNHIIHRHCQINMD